MFIVSKTLKGKEYLYSNKYSILCDNEKQANLLANHLNKNNDSTINDFKLNNNEIWHTYRITKYDNEPRYKLKNTKNSIIIVENC